MGARDINAAQTPCPNDNDLLFLLGGGAGAGPVDAHVAECSECRKVLAAFAKWEHSADEVRATHGARDSKEDFERLSGELLAPGTTLGRYVVRELAGQGAMGRVYVANDPQLDRNVALKVLRAAQTPGAETESRKRLLREARALARLAHPNVVAVHDVGSHDERVFIAMELVDGCTLSAWLDGPRSLVQVLDIFAQAGRGLAAAHGAGLIHRDFKPENVLVGSDGRARVTDFGLAHGALGGGMDATFEASTGPHAASSAASVNRTTRTGSVLGTPAYMAPEQRMGSRTPDARSDQFAFCVALYEALFGARPSAPAPAQPCPVPPTTRHGERIGGALTDLLLRGLRTAPSERFASMDALLRALDAAARGDGARARPPRHAARLFAIGALALAVAAGITLTQVSGRARASNETPLRDPALDPFVAPTRLPSLSPEEPALLPSAPAATAVTASPRLRVSTTISGRLPARPARASAASSTPAESPRAAPPKPADPFGAYE